MKIKLLISIISIFVLTSCNNNNDEQYLKLLEEENEFLNNEIERSYYIIKTLSKSNKTKYIPWKAKCDYLLKLKDSILFCNNYYSQKVHINELARFSENIYSKFEQNQIKTFLDFNPKTDNIILQESIKNKSLIIINKYIRQIIFLSDKFALKFTSLKAIVLFDKTTFKIGEEINARIFIAAFDTTAQPEIIIDGNNILDFDMLGRRIYKTKKYKKGIHSIKGEYKLKHPFYMNTLSFPFEAEYIVE